MTPKEKAEKLLKKMLSANPNRQDGITVIDTIQAKICALIAVDEILEILWHNHNNEIEYRFWKEVKQEIENL